MTPRRSGSLLALWALNLSVSAAAPSTCYGSTAQGRLSQGWALPALGDNFQAYSLLGVAAGRHFLHSQVQQVVLDAYGQLKTSAPNTHFVYGETGFATGGRVRAAQDPPKWPVGGFFRAGTRSGGRVGYLAE
ncbi:MAG: hypothetical protein ABWY06_00555 [Pseudomonas sp.]|uniref:hypothetical protein n=1 Tax=Pseudomonas sp. TaxID=306 RepID=UPI00339B9628